MSDVDFKNTGNVEYDYFFGLDKSLTANYIIKLLAVKVINYMIHY